MFRWFENLVDPFDPAAQGTPPADLRGFLTHYAKPFYPLLAGATLTGLISAFIEVALIWYMGRVVDLIATGAAGFWSRHGVELALVALALLLVRPAFRLFDMGLVNNALLPNFATHMRWHAHRHVLSQPVGWFERDFAGRLSNRVLQTPGEAGEMVYHFIDAIAYCASYAVGAAILLAGADPWLMLPLLAWLAGFVVLARWVVRHMMVASQRSSDTRSALSGRIVDSYANIHSVKLFASARQEALDAQPAMAKNRQAFAAEMRIVTTMDVILDWLNGVLTVSVIGLAVWLWSVGQGSAGSVAAASALVLRLSAMTGWLMWALTNFFRALGVVKEGMQTIAQPLEMADHAQAKDLEFRAGEIRIDQVHHHYGRGSGGLDGLSLRVAPGEKLALVGPSGAGKSTLVKLILRFYDPERGKVLIDGQDIAQIRQDDLRRYIGMVAQDTALLHRSIRDNIRYGKACADDAAMIAAAERADAAGFIASLADSEGRQGYDSVVGERGVKLSGGQRQRIALARAILKDAPILILDEATSALDSEAEAIIQQSLASLMTGKTVIAIAHRLSTIAAMDRIAVMDQGRIVEQGSHEQLLAAQGLYARLWARQSGGFIGIDAA